MHVHSARITAGHEARTRGRADRAGGIEVSELHAFLGQFVQHRGGMFRGAEGADIAVAKIITENDDDVGLGISRLR